ncbi:MAG: hypothetical protein ACHP65_07575 [Legionellales bacterium]
MSNDTKVADLGKETDALKLAIFGMFREIEMRGIDLEGFVTEAGLTAYTENIYYGFGDSAKSIVSEYLNSLLNRYKDVTTR